MLARDGQLYPAFALCLILSLFTFPYCLARGHGGGEHQRHAHDVGGTGARGGGCRLIGPRPVGALNREQGRPGREADDGPERDGQRDRVYSWGDNGRFRERGHWAGWARPWHRYWNGGGYWGGWPVYGSLYAGYPGYVNLDVNNRQTVDAEGRVYLARKYAYCGANEVSYNWPGNDGGQALAQGNAPGKMGAPSGDSDYRLGPDTDVLSDGSLVLHLTDEAYLRVRPKALEVVEQAGGSVVVKLFPDENLFIQLSSELERQSLGLKAHLAGRLDLRSGALEFAGKKLGEDGRSLKESGNLRYAIGLLEKARANLGDVSALVAYDKPPLPDFEGESQSATEVFASVFMLDDGSRLALRQPDGNFLYLDSKAVYAQPRGEASRLALSYPSQFMSVVGAYLTTLTRENAANLAVLEEEKARYRSRLALLQDYLRRIEAASSASLSPLAASPSSPSSPLAASPSSSSSPLAASPSSSSSPLAASSSSPSPSPSPFTFAEPSAGKASASRSDNEDDFRLRDPQIREGEKERYELLIARLSRHLEALERQTQASPAEVKLSKLVLANLGLCPGP